LLLTGTGPFRFDVAVWPGVGENSFLG